MGLLQKRIKELQTRATFQTVDKDLNTQLKAFGVDDVLKETFVLQSKVLEIVGEMRREFPQVKFNWQDPPKPPFIDYIDAYNEFAKVLLDTKYWFEKWLGGGEEEEPQK